MEGRPPSSQLPGPNRLLALAVAAASLAALVVASTLTPDVRGVETHTQLGLWPCGWLLSTGYPCPTCGMTTAFAHAAHRDLWTSIRVQPFGALMALGAAITFWGAVHVAVFGSRVGSLAVFLLRPRAVTLAGVLLLAAWLYKVLAVRS